MKKLIYIFLLFYFSMGLGARFLSQGAEDVYPFFSWFLFSKVPARIQSDFSMLIHQLGQEKFDPPIFFEEVAELYDTSIYSRTEFHTLIQRLALSIKGARQKEAMSFRGSLEKKFQARPVVYEIVERGFDVMERRKERKFLYIRSIIKFEYQN